MPLSKQEQKKLDELRDKRKRLNRDIATMENHINKLKGQIRGYETINNQNKSDLDIVEADIRILESKQ